MMIPDDELNFFYTFIEILRSVQNIYKNSLKQLKNPCNFRNFHCVDIFEIFANFLMGGDFHGKLRLKSLLIKFEMFGM